MGGSETRTRHSTIVLVLSDTAYQYDNHSFDHEPIDAHQGGRKRLQRLIDGAFDPTSGEDVYDPNSQTEQQKRRRQRRRVYSIQDESPHPTGRPHTQQQTHHIPVIAQVAERPDPSLVRLHYNPYEAGDRAHDISRLPPIELRPKYSNDSSEIPQRHSQRSNPPLFYQDSLIADRAATATNAYGSPKRLGRSRLETDGEATMRHQGGRVDQRHHVFHNDGVYVDTISKNPGEHRVRARAVWVEPNVAGDESTRNDYRDEYTIAKRSVVNTKNAIASIHDELQQIALSPPKHYHA